MHRRQAMDNQNSALASVEGKLHSSTCQSLEGQLLESTRSSQLYASSCSYASQSSGQVSASGKVITPAVHSGEFAAGGPSINARELSRNYSGSDLLTGSNHEEACTNQQPGLASRLAFEKQRNIVCRCQQDSSQASISGRGPKTWPYLPKIDKDVFSLAIEIFKFDPIQSMPMQPSSKSLTNVWGTQAQDVLPRKQVAATNLEASIEDMFTKLLGRRRFSSSKYLTVG